MMSVLMSRSKNQSPPRVAQDLGPSQGVLSNEYPNTQTQSMHIPSVQINILQLMPQFGNPEIAQYEGEIFAAVDKETKYKIEELERSVNKLKE